MTDIFIPESYGDTLVELPPGEKLHSVLGASGTERWMNCPGSIAMSKGMPNKSSIYAMEGTAAHHLGEMGLKQRLMANVFEGMWIDYQGNLLDDAPDVDDGRKTIFYDGELMDAVNPAFPINEGMVYAVNKYLETVEFYMDWARKEFGVEPILLVEKSFDLGVVWPGMFGTNDVCIFVPGHCLIVIDYKHGRGKVVEIRNNTQLRYYALGAILELCTSPEMLPKRVITVIVQPRASHKDGPVRLAEYTLEQITVDYRGQLVEAAKRTEAPDAELNTGDWCFFCPGKIKCPKITGKFTEMTKVSHYDLSEDELGMPSAVVEQIVKNVINDPELMGRFLAFAPIMESAIDAIREYALDQRIAGQIVPGQKLVRKDTKRKYRDEDAAAKDILATGQFKPSDIYTLKLKSASALKKLGAAKWRVIEPVLEAGDHVFKPEGAYTLAPVDDDRPEVVLDAFGDLSADDLAIEAPDFDIL